MNNQKWEMAKFKLQEQIKEERLRILHKNIERFKDWIIKYKGKEIEYGTKEYNEVKDTMTRYGVRDSGDSVATTLNKCNISFERSEHGLILL